MLFTLGVMTLWSATKATHGSQIPIAGFAITGYSTVLLWRNSANRCANAIEPNLSLLYHKNVRVLDIFLSRIALEILGATTSFAMLTIAFSCATDLNLPKNLGLLMLAWALMAWFAMALAMIVGALSESSEAFDRLWHTVTYLLFPLSGAVFMVDWLPTVAQHYVLLIPMVHGTEMLRAGYFDSSIKTHFDAIYLVKVNIIMTLIGLALTQHTARKVELQ
jgi:capsular polysaccharide transport system permease protein